MADSETLVKKLIILGMKENGELEKGVQNEKGEFTGGFVTVNATPIETPVVISYKEPCIDLDEQISKIAPKRANAYNWGERKRDGAYVHMPVQFYKVD